MATKIAFVGAGWIADFYKEAQARLSGQVELAGCCGNPSAEGRARLKAKCDAWGVRAYASYAEALKDPEVEAVLILSPTDYHADQVCAALEAGKHVLVEKPVALKADDYARLRKAASSADRLLFPGHNFVYRPVIRKAKEIIESGKLGKISYGSFRAAHFIPADHAKGWRRSFVHSGGGAMMDSGTHLVYQSLFLLGKPEYLSCFMAKNHYLEMEGEDACLISAQYSDGVIAQIYQSWCSSDDSSGEIRIQGNTGVLLVSDGLYLNGEKIEDDFSYQSSFYHTLHAFVQAVRGKGAALSDLADAETTLSIINSAYRSAATKSLLKL